MSDVLWLIPVLPLAAAVLVGLFGKLLRGQSHWPVVAAIAGSACVSLYAVVQLHHQSGPVAVLRSTPLPWFSAGGVNIDFQLVVDPITAVMLTAITFIGTWISIYSIGYMHDDPGYPRYFAVFSGFVFSMCGLVLTDNLLVLYGFWEGVGLCSYLLIGFWFAKPSAAAAARKAFLVTRLGDAAFVLGIFLLWNKFGTLEFEELFQAARAQPNEPILLTACLLLFCGAVGKSAQFPLHVWLPDAMEGPTPASALIHAATMVTAGVYLVGRTMPLFVAAPAALATVAVIGTITALLAALIALTQHDLKRVMAYSTVSQLGYMFAALGSGQGDLAAFAVTAAIFHLFTHAFFKALLFLASGSVMHAMGHVIDMRRIGGLRKALPITHWTFFIGAMALAGLPPFSGFWSKDEILAVAKEAGHGSAYHAAYLFVFYGLLLTALLTAFYTSRAYFRTFWGPEVIPAEAGHHGHSHDDHGHDHDHHASEPAGPGVAHESPFVMTGPLIVLAIGAACVGGLLAVTHGFAHFLGHTSDFVKYLPKHEHHADYGLMALSAGLSVVGIFSAWWIYVRNPKTAGAMARAVPRLYALSQNRFYLDEIYGWLAVGPLTAIAVISRVFDMLVDGIVDIIGRVPRFFGGLFRPVQNGLVQFYALATVLGLVVFIFVLAYLRGEKGAW
ncbi:MAG: NADH-quinone oxidoreductase subunit L [Gemmataceae bacterium]|nr:NADH-quinone oxidoreductase subunit L [Gemmataceae bacterium]